MIRIRLNWEKKNETYITHNKGLLRRSCEKIRKQLLLIWKALLLGGNAIGDHGMHLLKMEEKMDQVLILLRKTNFGDKLKC